MRRHYTDADVSVREQRHSFYLFGAVCEDYEQWRAQHYYVLATEPKAAGVKNLFCQAVSGMNSVLLHVIWEILWNFLTGRYCHREQLYHCLRRVTVVYLH